MFFFFCHGNLRGPTQCHLPPRNKALIKGLFNHWFPLIRPALRAGYLALGASDDLSGRNRPNGVLFAGFIRESLTPRVAEEFELMNCDRPDSRYFSYSLVKYKSL